jgi:hypothetical protein
VVALEAQVVEEQDRAAIGLRVDIGVKVVVDEVLAGAVEPLAVAKPESWRG